MTVSNQKLKSTRKLRSRTAIKSNYLPIEERRSTFKEVNRGYDRFQDVIEECERCFQCRKDPPPCQEYCPTKCNSREIIKSILGENIEEAIKIIFRHYVFPRSVERICPGFCQAHCTAGKKGDPIQIPLIKRYLVDHFAIPTNYFSHLEETGKKIAVIGSGPLGLTAAYFLRKYGHDVTIFEKLNVIGGMLAVGIPEFRLPKSVLNEEIDNLKKIGIKIIQNGMFNDEFDFKKLLNMGFDAIALGIGTHKPKWMKIPGENAKGVVHAIDFLRDINLNEKLPDLKGKKVIVVGGGNSATDAARVAKRLGADVYIVYRRQKEQMPAGKQEIDELEEEGIPLLCLTNPSKFVCGEDEIEGIICKKMKLGEIDKSGRPRPIPIEGSEFNMEADFIIEAISQEPDLTGFDEKMLEINRWNTFEVDEHYSTTIPGVFAGGDCVTGPKTVVEAIAQGKEIADEIHKYLGYEFKE